LQAIQKVLRILKKPGQLTVQVRKEVKKMKKKEIQKRNSSSLGAWYNRLIVLFVFVRKK
jgi:hypothetical protein